MRLGGGWYFEYQDGGANLPSTETPKRHWEWGVQVSRIGPGLLMSTLDWSPQLRESYKADRWQTGRPPLSNLFQNNDCRKTINTDGREPKSEPGE
jgi:hypothetical protein